MAKRKQHQEQKERYNGIVYILKIEIGVDIVYKVGTTNRAAITRALEVAGELHQMLGYIPKITIVAAKSTMFNYQVEADVLKLTEQWQYRLQCEREWSGQSELRKMQECDLMRIYDECMLKGYAPVETFKVGW